MGQDILNPPGWPSVPFQVKAGTNNPQNGNLVTTSNSIVTIPIIDVTPPFPAAGSPLKIVGFMQAFINQVRDSGSPNPGDINVTVLNVAGCSSTNNGAVPVVGVSGTSPVPVRLITPP